MNMKLDLKPDNRKKLKQILELIITFTLAVIVYILAARYDVLESIVNFSTRHENLEIDELLVVSVFLVFVLTNYSLRQWRKTQISAKHLSKTNKELQKALSEIKHLKGIFPICASCKKIRDDKGFWQQVEVYITKHTEAHFSHGICPECTIKLYPELFEDEIRNNINQEESGE